MEKKIIYTLISILFISNLIAQDDIHYKITYETIIQKPKEGNKKKKDKSQSKQEKDAKKYSDFIFKKLYTMNAISELIVKNNESKYITKKTLETDDVMIATRNTFNSFTKSSGIYYYNSKTNEELLEKNVFGKDFVITSTRDSISWTITKESKIIAGYTCYKATAEIKVKNAVKEGVKKNVSVWFSPTIPISIGPFDYSGLPGLILEVEVASGFGYITTIATKIELDVENIEIKKPNKGKIVTQEEFDEIGRKMFKNGSYLN